MSLRSSGVLLVLALAGCDSRPLVVGESPAGVGFSAGDGRSASLCADAAALRVAQPECWPTRHVGRWSGFITGDAYYRHVQPEPIEFPSGEVQIEIAPEGSGTILFAALAPGLECASDASTGDAGTDDAGVVGSRGCGPSDAGVGAGAQPGLVVDHRYTLDGLRMSGAPSGERQQDRQLAFSLLIAAPWAELCSAAPPELEPTVCICGASGCGVSTETLEVSLVLSRDGEALRGSVLSSSDLALSAGLELVRR